MIRLIRSIAAGPVARALVLAAAAGCGAAHVDGMHDEPPVAEPVTDAVAPADFSVYELPSAWRDQHGEIRRLESLRGRVQVVAMVYTSCAHACPRIVADMKRIEAAVAADDAGGVGFVLVTLDPERDTPERLHRFAEAARLDPARWTLLTAGDAEVLELAMLLGVKYRRVGEAEISHSNVITILDREGTIVRRQVGLGADPAPAIAAIRRWNGGFGAPADGAHRPRR